MNNYSNYHSHKMFTNITIADSPCNYTEYINRAIELNQSVITSVEHGWQGNYFLLHDLVLNKNKELEKRRKDGEINVPRNLKFIYGTEAYWVKDRHEKDKSNCHIIILAKNEKARKAINLVLSIANEDGHFNGRARLDFELLFSLPKDDVFITSACIGYWNKYEDIDEITLKLHNHFGNNFMLEVQNHNTKQQADLNKHILELSKEHNINIIAGMDTHYINEKDHVRREKILSYKGLHYEDEEGWFLDYPSYEIAYERFKVQSVLTDEQIKIALENTNIIETFDDIILDTNIKLPTMYPDLTQEEKNTELKKIINKEWDIFKEREKIEKSEYPMYLSGIRAEVDEVIKTNMTDYFILHYYGLKKGKDNGGRVTKRGRGSAVGFFINTLLGFSKVDRFKAPIKLYPERFMTADRIIKSRSLPDIDNNVDKQEPFVQGFKELLGEHGLYPMIAFGTLKKSSAIKLYMGAEGIDASIQNEVSKQLQEYDKAIKHCDTEEEKDEINISDYISKEYTKYVDLSKPYQGIVIQKSSHPCAYLLLNGDIREEIGIIRCESESTKKSVLTACIDGAMAEVYKFLKTDLLIVDVVGLTEDIWERVGKESITNNELEKILASDEGKETWDIYANGHTLCVNQCEKEGTKNKCMKYKMKNTAELSAFVAGIRPAFASLLNNFLNRKPYSTGVKELDDILKDSFHYMMYQESLMAYLGWLGIEMKETYDVIKKISKKKFKDSELEDLRLRCKAQWILNVGKEEGFNETWKVMQDAVSYAFNSAHSYCVGNDGAEIAYLKAYYPYETYEVCLNRFDEKKNKEKVSLLKEEMRLAFGIKEGELRFGLDNRKFNLDKENKCIHPSLTSIKNMGKNVAEDLYNLNKEFTFNNFYELLIKISDNTSINKAMLDILIKLDYFKEFGKSQKLLDFVTYYNLLQGKKAPKKSTISEKILDQNIINIINENSTPTEATYTKFDSTKCLEDIWLYLPNISIDLKDTIINRKELLGYVDYKNEKLNKRYALVSDINTKYTPVINTYCLNNGITCKCKISKKIWNHEPLQENDIIFIHAMERKFGHKKVGETTDKKGNIKPLFEVDESKLEWWITEYSTINNLDEVLEND
jgi:DNA polymerase III alpha subunit